MPERLGAAEGREAHAALGVEDGHVALGGAMQQEHRAHLVEHVHDVARRRAVGAEADAHPLVEHVGERRDAAAELRVALGAVRDGGVLGAQDADVVERRLRAVHGEEVLVEDVPLLQVLDRAHAVRLDEHALPADLLAEVVGELARARAHVGELVAALGDVARDLEALGAAPLGDRLVEPRSTRCRGRAP